MIDGFEIAAVNPPGPVQANVSPTNTGEAVNTKVFGGPEQIGPLLVAVTTGTGLSITCVRAVSCEEPTVRTTVYHPVSAMVINGFRLVFCVNPTKPPGPNQRYVAPVESPWA